MSAGTVIIVTLLGLAVLAGVVGAVQHRRARLGIGVSGLKVSAACEGEAARITLANTSRAPLYVSASTRARGSNGSYRDTRRRPSNDLWLNPGETLTQEHVFTGIREIRAVDVHASAGRTAHSAAPLLCALALRL